MSEAAAALAPNDQAPGGTDPAPQGNWYDGFSEGNKNLVMDRQWTGPEALVESYANLEKLTGVGPDRLLKLPKSDAPPEEWNGVWSKLGKPDSPEGYGFKAEEGQNAELIEWASKTFHELDLPKSAAEKLLAKYGELEKQQIEAEEARYAENLSTQANSLKKEWGAAFQQNVGLAKSAAAKLGMDEHKINALERVLGFDGVMKMFHDIGSRTGESDFVTGGGSPTGMMTPAAAKARISSLQGDPDFAKRYISGDSSARSEMEKLHKMAYPEE